MCTRVLPQMDKKISALKKKEADKHARDYANTVLQPAYVDLHCAGISEDRKRAKQDSAKLLKDSLLAKFPPKVNTSTAKAEVPTVLEEWREAVCDPFHENRGRGLARRNNLTPEVRPEPEEAAVDLNRPKKNYAATLPADVADEPVAAARFANAAVLPTLIEEESVLGNATKGEANINTKALLARFSDWVQQKSKSEDLEGLQKIS